MGTSKRMSAAALVLTASLSVGPSPPVAAADAAVKKGGASHVEAIKGSKLMRVILTKRATERLDIRTAEVTRDASGITTAPYSAVLYDVMGNTWVYTNPEPLAYVRHPIVIESIQGERAFLKEGPPAGTLVVVVGASELYGAESGVGH